MCDGRVECDLFLSRLFLIYIYKMYIVNVYRVVCLLHSIKQVDVVNEFIKTIAVRLQSKSGILSATCFSTHFN